MSTLTGQVRPLFNISQARAKQNCRTAHSALTNGDLATFTAFDASIDQPWLDNWAALMDAADAIPTDEVYRDNMEQKSAGVETAMKASRSAYKSLKFFVLKAFPNDSGVQKEFGLDDYKKARLSAELMHQFMTNMHLAALEHQGVLTSAAVAYPLANIATLSTIANDLLVANTDQELHKDRQASATRDRINALNAVWAPRQLIAAAAKIIYENDYAKYQEYLLPASEANADDFGIMGLVQDSASNAPIEGATASISILGLEVTSDENGNYGLADNIPAGEYTIIFTADGYQEFRSAVTITSADETIIVNALMVAE